MGIQVTDIKAARLGKYILNTYSADQVDKLLKSMEEKIEVNWDIKPPIKFILNTVLEETNVTTAELQSHTRLKEFVYARQSFCYLVAKIYDPDNLNGTSKFKYGSSMMNGLRTAIAEHLPTNVSMVSVNVKRVYNYVQLDKATRNEMTYLEELIYAKFQASPEFAAIVQNPFNE